MSPQEIFAARMLFVIRGGETKRYHTQNTLREQTVAAHSFGVAWIASLLADEYEDARPSYVMAGALTHDLAEHLMGDVPSPAKRLLGLGEMWNAAEQGYLTQVGLQIDDQLNEDEMRCVKFADNAEGALFCVREKSLGNRNMNETFTNYRKYLDEMKPATDREKWLVELIDMLWEKYDG